MSNLGTLALRTDPTAVQIVDKMQPPLDLAYRQLLLGWLDCYRSAKTQGAYGMDFGQWRAWCMDNGVDGLRPSSGQVAAWCGELRRAGRSEATVQRKMSAVLMFYKWARHEGYTDADPSPFRREEVHRDTAKNLGLSRDQLAAVVAITGDPSRERALVTLLAGCGLRVSEAVAVNVPDLREQQAHRVIAVMGKGQKPRSVPIPIKTYRVLTDYIGDRTDGPLFLARNGARWNRGDIWRTVERIGKAAGVPGLHPHIFRHTCATLMLESGAPLDRVQKVLGHASPVTTMAYAEARDRLDSSPVYDLDRYLGDIW